MKNQCDYFANNYLYIFDEDIINEKDNKFSPGKIKLNEYFKINKKIIGNYENCNNKTIRTNNSNTKNNSFNKIRKKLSKNNSQGNILDHYTNKKYICPSNGYIQLELANSNVNISYTIYDNLEGYIYCACVYKSSNISYVKKEMLIQLTIFR
jgi:hypothetical protein